MLGDGDGVLVDAGLAVAPLTPLARALPGARLGSCHGVAAVPGKALAGGLMVFPGWYLTKGRRLLSAYLILNVFTKIYMPPRGCLPNPCPLGAVDSRVICSVGVGRVAAARVLPGLLELFPGKDLAGGVRFVPFALCGLGLGVVLLLLSFSLTLAHLPCLAQCGGARGSDCPCTVIGVQKVYPSFCTPTGAPGPGPHISATRCWARPKNGARAGGAVFTTVRFFARCASPRPARTARRGRVCVTWAACVGRFPHAYVTS